MSVVNTTVSILGVRGEGCSLNVRRMITDIVVILY